MFRVFSFFLTFCLICLPVTAAPATPTGSTPIPPEIQAAYNSLTDAWVRLDYEGVMRHFAPDASILDGRGQLLDRAHLEDTVREALEGSLTCRISYKVLSSMEGDGGMVVRTHQERYIDYGDKKVLRIAEREDTWRLGEEGWHIGFVRFLTQTATIDTKLVRPGRP